jgi:hypothetical protein
MKNSRSATLSLLLIPLLLILQSCSLTSPKKQRGGSTISSVGYHLSEGDVAIAALSSTPPVKIVVPISSSADGS